MVVSDWLPPSSPLYLWDSSSQQFTLYQTLSTPAGNVQQFTPFEMNGLYYMAASYGAPCMFSTLWQWFPDPKWFFLVHVFLVVVAAHFIMIAKRREQSNSTLFFYGKIRNINNLMKVLFLKQMTYFKAHCFPPRLLAPLPPCPLALDAT